VAKERKARAPSNPTPLHQDSTTQRYQRFNSKRQRGFCNVFVVASSFVQMAVRDRAKRRFVWHADKPSPARDTVRS
jgi:predicted secreted protein